MCARIRAMMPPVCNNRVYLVMYYLFLAESPHIVSCLIAGMLLYAITTILLQHTVLNSRQSFPFTPRDDFSIHSLVCACHFFETTNPPRSDFSLVSICALLSAA